MLYSGSLRISLSVAVMKGLHSSLKTAVCLSFSFIYALKNVDFCLYLQQSSVTSSENSRIRIEKTSYDSCNPINFEHFLGTENFTQQIMLSSLKILGVKFSRIIMPPNSNSHARCQQLTHYIRGREWLNTETNLSCIVLLFFIHLTFRVCERSGCKFPDDRL